MKRKLLALASALGLAAGLIAASGAAATAATSAPLPLCSSISYADLSAVQTDYNGTPTTGYASLLSSSAPLSGGVGVFTPDNGSKVYVRDASSTFKLSGFSAGSYSTYKYDTGNVVLPSYQLEVFLSGHAGTATDPLPVGWVGTNYATLVYEPYQDQGNAAVQTGVAQSWDVVQSGAAKWWATHPLTAIPGDNGQATPETLSSIKAAYPNALVISFGLDQGTYNAGAMTVFNHLFVKDSAGCATYNWAAPALTQSTSAFAKANASKKAARR